MNYAPRKRTTALKGLTPNANTKEGHEIKANDTFRHLNGRFIVVVTPRLPLYPVSCRRELYAHCQERDSSGTLIGHSDMRWAFLLRLERVKRNDPEMASLPAYCRSNAPE